MDETKKLRSGFVFLAATCLVAVALLWAGGFVSQQRVQRAHRDPLKILLRGILL